MGVGFLPPLLDRTAYDMARGIDEDEGREAARRQVPEEGILAGTSTWLNVAGALHLAKEMGPEDTLVTVHVVNLTLFVAGLLDVALVDDHVRGR